METCMYCMPDERLHALMFEICTLAAATVYIYRENTYPGRCVLALNRHMHKVTELPDDLRTALFSETAMVAKAITALYAPDKINYLILGDCSDHLHIHVVPKYAGGADFGSVFQMMPHPPHMRSREECLPMIEALRDEIYMQGKRASHQAEGGSI